MFQIRLKDPYRVFCSFFFKTNVEPRYQKTFRGNFEPPLQSKCPQNWCMHVKGQDIPSSTFNVACITLLLPRGNNVVHLNKRLHRSWTKVYLWNTFLLLNAVYVSKKNPKFYCPWMIDCNHCILVNTFSWISKFWFF